MKSFSLLETRTRGWRWLYRGKKAHYFINREALCNKRTITEYEEGGLLPQVNHGEHCKKCVKKAVIINFNALMKEEL